MPQPHEFKPYADAPDYCVAELDNGDTCNRAFEDHAMTVQPTQLLLEVYRRDDADDGDMALEELHRRAVHCGDVAAREVLNDYDRDDPEWTPTTGSEAQDGISSEAPTGELEHPEAGGRAGAGPRGGEAPGAEGQDTPPSGASGAVVSGDPSMSAMADLDLMLRGYEDARNAMVKTSGSTVIGHLQAAEEVIRQGDILVNGLRSMLAAAAARPSTASEDRV